MGDINLKRSPAILIDSEDYFKGIVGEALSQRKMITFPLAQNYLVQLLNQFIATEKLEDQTLAEMFLKAQNTTDINVKVELLKKLGDVSLYISGLFSESLDRKLVDVDYYADMGGAAYGSLSETIKEDSFKKVYKEYSNRFLEFVDVLTIISQKVFLHDNESILRLYNKYLRTGSELARETLLEKGIISIPFDKNKKNIAQ